MMGYDPEKVRTSDEVTEFMSKLYEALSVDVKLPVLRQQLEERGVDTTALLVRAERIKAEAQVRRLRAEVDGDGYTV